MSFESKYPKKKVKITMEIEVEITSVDFWDELKNLDQIYEDNFENIPESIRDHLEGDLFEDGGDHIADEYACGWHQIQFTITDIDSKSEFIEVYD